VAQFGQDGVELVRGPAGAELGRRGDHRRAGLGDDLPDLVLAVDGDDGHVDRADPERGHLQDQGLEAVGQLDHDPVPALDAAADEIEGHGGDPGVELAVADPAALEDEQFPVRRPGGLVPDQVADPAVVPQPQLAVSPGPIGGGQILHAVLSSRGCPSRERR
jgi:hypothetical protein